MNATPLAKFQVVTRENWQDGDGNPVVRLLPCDILRLEYAQRYQPATLYDDLCRRGAVPWIERFCGRMHCLIRGVFLTQSSEFSTKAKLEIAPTILSAALASSGAPAVQSLNYVDFGLILAFSRFDEESTVAEDGASSITSSKWSRNARGLS